MILVHTTFFLTRLHVHGRGAGITMPQKKPTKNTLGIMARDCMNAAEGRGMDAGVRVVHT
jgi:hypothetical protein